MNKKSIANQPDPEMMELVKNSLPRDTEQEVIRHYATEFTEQNKQLGDLQEWFEDNAEFKVKKTRQNLLKTAEKSLNLNNPFRILLCGISGGGKTELLRCLVGPEKAKYFPSAGGNPLTAAVIDVSIDPEGQSDTVEIVWRTETDIIKVGRRPPQKFGNSRFEITE